MIAALHLRDAPVPALHADRHAAVVVGGSGFIGSHLLRALRRAGVPAASFTATRPAVRRGEPAPDILAARTVFFVAGTVTPVTADERPGQVQAELRLFDCLLRATQHAATSPRVVLASSGGTVYAPDARPPYDEQDNIAPSNRYGAMKLAMEGLLRAHPGVEPVTVRLANLYGPGQHPRRGQGVVAHWMHAATHGQPLVLHGDPTSTRDYLYIDDAVDLLVRIHQAEHLLPSVLNAGSGTPTTLAQLARLVMDVTGCGRLKVESRKARPVDRLHVWLRIDRARQALGWSPQITLQEGLRRMWATMPARPVRLAVPSQHSRSSTSLPPTSA